MVYCLCYKVHKMIKKIMLMIALTLFVNADYLNLKANNICVYDLTPYQNNTGWCYTDRITSTVFCDPLLTIDDLIAGYDLNGTYCVLKNDLRITGLTESEYNFYLALIANFMGFTMLFLISFLSVLVTRK